MKNPAIIRHHVSLMIEITTADHRTDAILALQEALLGLEIPGDGLRDDGVSTKVVVESVVRGQLEPGRLRKTQFGSTE